MTDPATPPPLRVGLVGARRVRQGLGPFVARDLTSLGARVTHVLGRTSETAAAAADGVAKHAGTRPAPLHDADAFDEAELDAVCVLTPKGHHLEAVERALARGRHVLVEKPLLWHGPDVDGPDVHGPRGWGERAGALEERFAARGLAFGVNAQWPWTLDAFAALEGAPADAPARLEMGLSPASTGRDMIGDALPHPLSLALALRPDVHTVETCQITTDGEVNLVVEATLSGSKGPFQVRAALDGAERTAPRTAWYAIDGVRVDRCVRAADYALFLRSGSRIVDMEDPLHGRLASFCEDVRRAEAGGRSPRAADPTIAMSMRLLEAIDRAWTDTLPADL